MNNGEIIKYNIFTIFVAISAIINAQFFHLKNNQIVQYYSFTCEYTLYLYLIIKYSP